MPSFSGGEFDALLSSPSGLQAHAHLALKLSGEAELTVNLKPGEPPLIRTGVWRQSGEAPLIVVMAAENGAPLAQRVQLELLPDGKDLNAKSLELPGFDSGPLRLFRRDEIRPPVDGAFVGSTWVWMADSSQRNSAKSVSPAEFTLQFRADGWFNFHTDCGEGSGMYETYGQEIALAAIHVTENRCNGETVHGHFLKSLEDAGRFRLNEDRLFLDMKHEARTSVFYRHP